MSWLEILELQHTGKPPFDPVEAARDMGVQYQLSRFPRGIGGVARRFEEHFFSVEINALNAREEQRLSGAYLLCNLVFHNDLIDVDLYDILANSGLDVDELRRGNRLEERHRDLAYYHAIKLLAPAEWIHDGELQGLTDEKLADEVLQVPASVLAYARQHQLAAA